MLHLQVLDLAFLLWYHYSRSACVVVTDDTLRRCSQLPNNVPNILTFQKTIVDKHMLWKGAILKFWTLHHCTLSLCKIGVCVCVCVCVCVEVLRNRERRKEIYIGSETETPVGNTFNCFPNFTAQYSFVFKSFVILVAYIIFSI